MMPESACGAACPVPTRDQPLAALPRDAAEPVAQWFKVLADPTRVRIVAALAQGERCVCDLAAHLAITPSALSHQLRMLRLQRIVTARRAGTTIYYRVTDDHIRAILQMTLDHLADPESAEARR
jgi:DNA-binding transcriptional ArsR family regulator